MAKKVTKNTTKFDSATYLKWYEMMLLMRKFEEKCGFLYVQQKFGGFCHLYIGQEAVAAGMVTGKGKDDKIITAYRDHGHPLCLGMDPGTMMAELYGKVDGSSKGKGGSMHMFDIKRNFWGGHGIVGGQIPLGAGLAFADKYNGKKIATICMMGDGAVRQGALHETFNMAMTWKLPVVFVVENNNYAMGTSVERTSNVTELATLGKAYDMPSYSVNGMKCEDVHIAINEACTRARNGEGPTWLEIKTYRYKGHSMSDPQKYRTKEEVQEYKNQDPLFMVLEHIRKNKLITEKKLTEIQNQVKEKVEGAVKFAENSLEPDAAALFEDVYAEEGYPFIVD